MIKTTSKNVIDVNDWDNLVEKTYGKKYCFQQQDGCQDRGHFDITVPGELYEEEMNDSIPEVINGEGDDKMSVKFSVWLARDIKTPLNPSEEELKKCYYYFGKTDEDLQKWKEDESHILLFWERNFYPDIQAVANDLHEKGLIKAGDYAINIDW